jgi:hypothetical protein
MADTGCGRRGIIGVQAASFALNTGLLPKCYEKAFVFKILSGDKYFSHIFQGVIYVPKNCAPARLALKTRLNPRFQKSYLRSYPQDRWICFPLILSLGDCSRCPRIIFV